MGREYNQIHRKARGSLKDACERCGGTTRLEAALRPDVPPGRLLVDEDNKCKYSLHVTDYFTLCKGCHKHMDAVELRPTCRQGHRYTKENTSVKTDGSRRCLTCHREEEKRRLKNPENRKIKNQQDKDFRKKNPMTSEQKERKLELQRIRRRNERG